MMTHLHNATELAQSLQEFFARNPAHVTHRRGEFVRAWLGSPWKSAKTYLSAWLGKAACAPRPKSSARFGVNVIGFAEGQFGLGVMTRSLLANLSEAGVPYRVISHRVRLHAFEGNEWVERSIDEDFPINIVVITPDRWMFDSFVLRRSIDLSKPSIAYWAWELEQPAPSFSLAAKVVDEIWSISQFAADSLGQLKGKNARVLPIRVEPPKEVLALDRAAFGIKAGEVVFGFVFDAASFIERKNPLDAVKAFQMAFAPSCAVRLVIKLHNSAAAAQSPHMRQLRQLIREDARIVWIDEKWSQMQVWQLMKLFDVYLSLHRAEGLGLTVGEALALNKPVICTRYGGVMEFEQHPLFYGVAYTRVPIATGAYPQAQGQFWAQPDLIDAAQKMRHCHLQLQQKLN